MNNYLVFKTEAAASVALETIYANMVGSINLPDLKNVVTGEVVDKDDLTTEAAAETNPAQRNFPIFGVNAASNAKNPDAGYTTAWATAQQRVTDNKWVFPEPAESLMANVVGYAVEPYDLDWFSANELSE
jgi:hypothetical protein